MEADALLPIIAERVINGKAVAGRLRLEIAFGVKELLAKYNRVRPSVWGSLEVHWGLRNVVDYALIMPGL